MRKILLVQLILFCCLLKGYGQSLSILRIVEPTQNYLCPGKRFVIAYQKLGDFKSDNKVILKITNTANKPLLSIDTKDSSGFLVGTLPDFQKIPGFEITYNVSNSNFKLQVASTSPEIIAEPYNNYYQVAMPISVSLDTTSASVFKGSVFPLKLKGTGSKPLKIVTSEGTIINYDVNYLPYNEDFQVNAYPQKSGEFFIKEVSNMCGVGKSQGKVNLEVTDNFLRVSGVHNTRYCAGGELKVSVEKNGTWNSSNKFFIRLTNRFNPNATYDLEAKEVDGTLSAIIPTTVSQGAYSLKLLATSPRTVSLNSLLEINIAVPSKIDLASVNQTINFGSSISLGYNSEGVTPINIKLNDGTVHMVNYLGNYSFLVRPTKSTDYKITRFVSECISGTGNNIAKITVRDGFKVESIPNPEICPGGTFKVKFSSQPVAAVNSNVNLAVKFLEGGFLTLTGKVTADGIAEFQFPKVSEYTGKRFFISLYTNTFSELLNSYNEEIVCLFNSIPTISNWYLGQYTENQKAGWVYFDAAVRGGGTIEFENNWEAKTTTYSTYSSSYLSSKFFAPKSATYKVTKISNACGVNENPGVSFDLKIDTPANSISLQAPFITGGTVCIGTKHELTLLKKGLFDAVSKFYLDIVREDGSIIQANVAEFVNDKATWTVPSQYQSVYLQVRATSPNITAERIKLFTSYPPSYSGAKEITGRVEGNLQNTYSGYFQLDNVSQTTAIFDNGARFESSNGFLNYTITYNSGKKNFDIQLTNGCGTAKEKIQLNIKQVDKTVIISSYNNSQDVSNCVGKKLSFKFYEMTFYPTQRASTYKLILRSKSNNKVNQVIQTGITQSPVEFVIPQNLDGGNYGVSLMDEQDSLITSSDLSFKVNTLPNVEITEPKSQAELSINDGESVSLKITSSNGTTFNGVLIGDNGEVYPISSNENNLFFTPSKSATYSLKSVYNGCGVKELNYKVTVKIKPDLKWFTVGKSNTLAQCRDEKLYIWLSPSGDINTTKKYKFVMKTLGSNNPKSYDVATIKPTDSYFYLSIPSNIPMDQYSMELLDENNTRVGSGSISFYLIDAPKVNIAGSTTTMANQNVSIRLSVADVNSNNALYGFPTYELSNGTKGTIYNSAINYAFISFKATKSETVTLKTISNQCGVGSGTGSANITVLSENSNYILTRDPAEYIYFQKLCAGATATIGFNMLGTVNPIPSLTLQMSDKNGENFKDIPTTNPIVASTGFTSFQIPNTTPEGQNYRFRIVAKDNSLTSTSNISPIAVVKGAVASFDTTQYYFAQGKTVDLKVNLSGSFPMSFKVGTDEVTAQNYTTSYSPYVIQLNPTTPVKYRLFSVEDGMCGTGTIGSNSTVSLELVTGFEDIQKLGVTVGPNPATDFVTIHTDENGIKAELVDVSGNVVSEIKLNAGSNQLDLKSYQNGIYLLRISKDQKVGIFKLMKY